MTAAPAPAWASVVAGKDVVALVRLPLSTRALGSLAKVFPMSSLAEFNDVVASHPAPPALPAEAEALYEAATALYEGIRVTGGEDVYAVMAADLEALRDAARAYRAAVGGGR